MPQASVDQFLSETDHRCTVFKTESKKPLTCEVYVQLHLFLRKCEKVSSATVKIAILRRFFTKKINRFSC